MPSGWATKRRTMSPLSRWTKALSGLWGLVMARSLGADRQPAGRTIEARPEQEHSFKLCQEIAQLLAPIQATQVNQGGGGADIGPIVAQGVASLSPTTTAEHYFDWHHTQADTVDKVDPREFKKNTAMLAVLAYILADMPEKLAGR